MQSEVIDGAAVVLKADRMVVRSGRSQSITIPNHIAEQIGLEIGESVRLSVLEDGRIVVEQMETVHLPQVGTIIRPKVMRIHAPKVIPVITEGRTIRKAGIYMAPAEGHEVPRRRANGR